jgi:hypothetical protein
VVADLILQYDPRGNYSLTNPAPCSIALWRVFTGTLLGVLCIPLTVAGDWLVCSISSALFWVMAYAIVIATVFHSSFLAVILTEQAAHAASGLALTPLLQLRNTPLGFSLPLAALFEVSYLVVWSVIGVTILRGSQVDSSGRPGALEHSHRRCGPEPCHACAQQSPVSNRVEPASPAVLSRLRHCAVAQG